MRFILSKKDRCKTYIRYYYSPLFKKYSYEIHRSKYTEILDGFKAAFVDEVDVWVEFNHIFHIILSSAMRVFDGELDETAETEEKIFFLIYSVIKPHLKNNADK